MTARAIRVTTPRVVARSDRRSAFDRATAARTDAQAIRSTTVAAAAFATSSTGSLPPTRSSHQAAARAQAAGPYAATVAWRIAVRRTGTAAAMAACMPAPNAR